MATTPGRRRENKFHEPGVAGRKTGIRIGEVEKDAEGFEDLDAFFRSPGGTAAPKSSPRRGPAGRLGQGRSDESLEEEIERTVNDTGVSMDLETSDPISPFVAQSRNPPSSHRRLSNDDPDVDYDEPPPPQPARSPAPARKRLSAAAIRALEDDPADQHGEEEDEEPSTLPQSSLTQRRQQQQLPARAAALTASAKKRKSLGANAFPISSPSRVEQAVGGLQPEVDAEVEEKEEVEERAAVSKPRAKPTGGKGKGKKAASPSPAASPKRSGRARPKGEGKAKAKAPSPSPSPSPSPTPEEEDESDVEAEERAVAGLSDVEEEEEGEEEDLAPKRKRAKKAQPAAKPKSKPKANTRSKKVEPAAPATKRSRPPPSSSSRREPALPSGSQPQKVGRLQSETPDPEVSQGLRRSGRARMAPLAGWKLERVDFEGNVYRTPEPDMEHKPARAKRRAPARDRGASVSAPMEPPDIAPEEGWDAKTDPMGIVIDYETGQEHQRRIAFTSAMVQPRETFNSEFRFQKIFGDGEFCAAGMLVIPKGSTKPPKPARDNTYVFFMIEGAARITVHRTSFVIAPGGMWIVPRGNHYQIENMCERDVKIFFSQARMVQVQAFDGEEEEGEWEEESGGEAGEEQEEEQEEEEEEEPPKKKKAGGRAGR